MLFFAVFFGLLFNFLSGIWSYWQDLLYKDINMLR